VIACTVCGADTLKATEYKVVEEGTPVKTFPAFECSGCGAVALDVDRIDPSEDVPDSIRDRCHRIAIGRHFKRL
jgi:hypothetical protein